MLLILFTSCPPSCTAKPYVSMIRIRAHKGHQVAIVAVAHHLLVAAYHILRDGTEYQELGGDYFDRQNKPKTVSRLVARWKNWLTFPTGACGSPSRRVALPTSIEPSRSKSTTY